MKYLSHYIENKQTELFDEMGVFFAFSNEQFDKQKKEGIQYISIGAGMICPKSKVEEFSEKHLNLVKEGIAQDIKENGIENIILRELGNYECFYTGSIEDCVEALERYGISEKAILETFRAERKKGK